MSNEACVAWRKQSTLVTGQILIMELNPVHLRCRFVALSMRPMLWAVSLTPWAEAVAILDFGNLLVQ